MRQLTRLSFLSEAKNLSSFTTFRTSLRLRLRMTLRHSLFGEKTPSKRVTESLNSFGVTFSLTYYTPYTEA